jgi:xylulokinase
LPDVELQNKTIGTLLPAVADELGLPSKTPVSIGGGDNMMGAIGTGNVTTGIVTMSLGTSGTVYAYSDTPVVDPEGNIAAFCSSTGGWLPLLCTMNCTVGTELMRDLFKVDLPTFEAQLAAAGRGADGMITVPFFNGERTPNLPNAKGCILGMDSRNMRTENFLRSAVESATFGLRFGLNGLAERGIEANEIVLTGGGASSDIWRQIVADICNAPVTVLTHDEGAALGAALQALAMLNGEGMVNLADEHLQPDVERCCEPRPSAVDSYNQIYQTYQRAVGQVAQFYL